MSVLYVRLAAGAIVFGVGFAAAWKLQAVKLDALQNEFTGYKLKQQEVLNDHNQREFDRREQTAKAWADALDFLRSENERNFAAYKRCVAAGRCGAVIRDVCLRTDQPQARPGGREDAPVPPASAPDAAGGDAVSTAAGLAADCSETTLKLNMLQADIEKQEGY